MSYTSPISVHGSRCSEDDRASGPPSTDSDIDIESSYLMLTKLVVGKRKQNLELEVKIMQIGKRYVKFRILEPLPDASFSVVNNDCPRFKFAMPVVKTLQGDDRVRRFVVVDDCGMELDAILTETCDDASSNPSTEWNLEHYAYEVPLEILACRDNAFVEIAIKYSPREE